MWHKKTVYLTEAKEGREGEGEEEEEGEGRGREEEELGS